MCKDICSQLMWKLQGALGKLALVKDKASDGVAAVRKKLGRNKDIQCRVHLKVTGSHDLLMYLVAWNSGHCKLENRLEPSSTILYTGSSHLTAAAVLSEPHDAACSSAFHYRIACTFHIRSISGALSCERSHPLHATIAERILWRHGGQGLSHSSMTPSSFLGWDHGLASTLNRAFVITSSHMTRESVLRMVLLQVTYYEFRKEEVDAAMEGHKKHQLTHVPSRIENKEAFNILMVHTSVSLSACSAPAIKLCKALLPVV